MYTFVYLWVYDNCRQQTIVTRSSPSRRGNTRVEIGYKTNERIKTDQRRRDVSRNRYEKDETSKITTYAITADCESHLNTAQFSHSLIFPNEGGFFFSPLLISSLFKPYSIRRFSSLPFLSLSLILYRPFCITILAAFFEQDYGMKSMVRSKCYHRTSRCSLN